MKINKIEHIAIMTSDMDQSIHFYETMFGFEVRARGENNMREMTFLRHKDWYGMELELIRDLSPQFEYSSAGIVNHLAFTVGNIEEAIKSYKEKEIEFKSDAPNIAIDGAKTIFFYGPNQELLQLVEPVNDKK